ncbi:MULTISPECIES: hypothetical protein [Mesonia]|uniref:Uncharacterized protein n=1 Tax=Mesonia oceanica TaxID=2687242 RepID=A0AC61Y443_9FLAO|nr:MULTISPECIES: hypothetical protein [Mesonia]MAN28801.1 hypothetical protein [Mesonia sp.]MAQ41867.1 hypothetical protein [Mesonia sp.]MBJ99010.1 hypothetical protein [Flavobacteriaceae bacterium]VVU99210.1 hypothetical protein FVB9532_00462 [Mesonia oceanica]|tara:strand:+ start:47014 stop:50076 length:3063 start_codon:yes stop_codon:yes gene_type:complete
MYFFIDPANLTTQSDTEAYGPISIIDNPDGSQSSVDPSQKFNVTSYFSLINEAKAFACVDGQLIVQQSNVDNSLVNIIIKPCSILDVPIEVEYYIYRGILKSSLIDEQNNSILPQGTGVNDLINRIWQDPPSDASYGTLGYDDGELNSNVNIEDVFNFLIPGIDSVYIMEGEWLGMFSNIHKIGFEVILKSDNFLVNLNYVRSSGYVIDVTNLSGINERVKREEILNFLDPAALYGMHFNEGVKYYDINASNNTQTTSTNASNNKFLYTKLIEKFYSKNKIYIDIRSEKGYSYNFYQNYKVSGTDSNNIQIRTQSGNSSLNAQEYQTNQWPILILTAIHASGNENSLKLSLRIDDNISPILYTKTNLNKDVRNVANTSSTNVGSRYFKTNQLIGNETNSDHTTWTNVFRILFPNTQSGTSRAYISNYVRLHYYRTKHNFNNANNSVLENIHYYDSAFCSIDIPQFSLPDNLDVGSVESTNPIYVREPLHYDANHPNYDANYNLEGTGNFELNMINGAYWGDSLVLMYARIEYENTAKTSEKEYLNTYDQQLSSFEQNYSYRLFRDRLKFLCREYNITGNNNTTKIPSINFFRSNDLADSGKNYKENCMLLGLTIDEMISIKADTQLSDNHQRFIHLEPLAGNPQEDNNNNRYFSYTVRLQGFDSNQHADIVTPQYNSNDIIVYSRDNQFFSSYAFAENEDITALQDGTILDHRIEFRVYHDGIVKITDNLDLALALAYDQNRIHYVYYDANDNTSEMQGISENAAGTENGFELVMADKMRRKRYSRTAIDYPEAEFPNLNTLTFIDNYQLYGITNVSAGNTYSNERGDILAKPASNVGFRWYRNQKWEYENEVAKCFLVKFISNRNPDQGNPITLLEFTNINPNINLRYHQTMRLYPSLEVAAAMIGALIMFNNNVQCTGFAYVDASCYPSALHVNGESIDTSYQGTTELNVSFINALRAFGFSYFRIGVTGHNTSDSIYNHTDFNNIRRDIFRRDSSGTLHSTHLHSEQVTLKNGDRVI